MPLCASLEAGLLPSPPQAAIIVLTRPAAPPVSAVRRVIAASGERSGVSSLGVRPFQAFEGVVDGIELRHCPSSSWWAVAGAHCYRSHWDCQGECER